MADDLVSIDATAQAELVRRRKVSPLELPIGIQLVAAYGREDLLLRVAAKLESSLPWLDRRPAIHA
jgi:Asp-tRNA(Asn)/Glu-tRNA(Gln) amidotransferase A subunit family amidase